MIKFKVLQKQIEYKNCPIVIRQVGEAFEYITCINNLLYSSYVIARKPLLARLFGRSYSQKQLEKFTNYVINMAYTTIDSVIEPVATEKKKK